MVCQVFTVELHQLKLDRNNLSMLPEAITSQATAALKDLQLVGNQLQGLPDYFAALQSLTELNLSANKLSQVPGARLVHAADWCTRAGAGGARPTSEPEVARCQVPSAEWT